MVLYRRTLVITEDGLKPICEIVRGEEVLSQNEEIGVQTYEEVELVRKAGQEIITLRVENELINTTPEHPFMTDRGLVEANDTKTIQLLPTKINSTFGHLGGVGEINSGAYKNK